MRFLDLDLDFFLNHNAYGSGSDSGRLGSEYKPWSVFKVRHFLEERCSLSHDAPVPGRTVESHDRVLDFWPSLLLPDFMCQLLNLFLGNHNYLLRLR